MADIINLLPDSVANQIAAGEVIQRPASVVKELMENAIDSGATEIKLIIKDAGKTLVQVIDNGCGMSDTDARMAFERHATSKIKSANDLFAIRTMGFRGEALASVAAIADVELKTRLHDQELGTYLHIQGSEVLAQEPAQCQAGSNFCIKNLFFNVPARRKFLKTNHTELKHIINEFQRVALANPGISLTMQLDGHSIYKLKPENRRKRIVGLYGKTINQHLIPVESDTAIAKVKGYMGKPEVAKKRFGDQFFFVNNRFMRHPYFHKAVTAAYEKILPSDYNPCYFLYFDVDPDTIDINIHPTKTEVKFEDERALWQILQASLKQSLGKFNIVPSLEFDNERHVNVPVFDKNKEIVPPKIEVDTSFNPFQQGQKQNGTWQQNKKTPDNWQELYKGFEEHPGEENHTIEPSSINENEPAQAVGQGENLLQFKNKYILTPVKSGLMVIHQGRAHQRILFERFMQSLQQHKGVSQQNLFPKTFEINPGDKAILMEIMGELNTLGFNIREFGETAFVIEGCPGILTQEDPVELIRQFIENVKETDRDILPEAHERVAYALAKAAAIKSGKKMHGQETRVLVDQLFACGVPNYSPSGKPVIAIIQTDEIDKKLKNF